MRFSLAATLLLLILSPLAGAAEPAKSEDAGSDPLTLDAGVAAHAGIDRIYRKFAAGYATLDSALVAAQYADDALYLQPDADVVRSRASILRGFEDFFGAVRRQNGTIGISFRILARQVSGDLGYDVGIFTLSTGQGAMKGKFAVVTRKGADGVWRFEVDAYNTLPKP